MRIHGIKQHNHDIFWSFSSFFFVFFFLWCCMNGCHMICVLSCSWLVLGLLLDALLDILAIPFPNTMAHDQAKQTMGELLTLWGNIQHDTKSFSRICTLTYPLTHPLKNCYVSPDTPCLILRCVPWHTLTYDDIHSHIPANNTTAI